MTRMTSVLILNKAHASGGMVFGGRGDKARHRLWEVVFWRKEEVVWMKEGRLDATWGSLYPQYDASHFLHSVNRKKGQRDM
jgi:hypothetical protein